MLLLLCSFRSTSNFMSRLLCICGTDASSGVDSTRRRFPLASTYSELVWPAVLRHPNCKIGMVRQLLSSSKHSLDGAGAAYPACSEAKERGRYSSVYQSGQRA